MRSFPRPLPWWPPDPENASARPAGGKAKAFGATVVAKAILYPHDATPFATEAACREVLSEIARDLQANDKEFKAFLEEAGAVYCSPSLVALG